MGSPMAFAKGEDEFQTLEPRGRIYSPRLNLSVLILVLIKAWAYLNSSRSSNFEGFDYKASILIATLN